MTQLIPKIEKALFERVNEAARLFRKRESGEQKGDFGLSVNSLGGLVCTKNGHEPEFEEVRANHDILIPLQPW